MKKVILVSAGVFHPPIMGRWAVHRALANMDGFSFRRITSLESLPGQLEDIAAVVIYIHQATLSDRALAALEHFVQGGGGVLAIHSATASFKETLPYFKILGGRFIGHGPVAPFEVIPVPGENAPFSGIEKFTITDELYLHELQPGIVPHFIALHDGQEIPVVWTYHYGQGRVCYAVPGHTTGSMQHPAVQAILRRGLAWVCGV